MSKILVVDDEANLRHTVGYNLLRAGHEVIEAADGEAAIAVAQRSIPDLVILDIMLPGIDGFEVCRRMRSFSSVPLLMLTARDAEIDRVVGLEIGADDYLAKPFSMRELLARVKAMLRRADLDRSVASAPDRDKVDTNGLSVQLARRRVFVDGHEIQLKPREFDLLAFLVSRPGQVFTRDVLLQGVWGYEYAGDTRTVDVHVRALRDKLGDRAEAPRWLETVWGVGYRFLEKAHQ